MYNFYQHEKLLSNTHKNLQKESLLKSTELNKDLLTSRYRSRINQALTNLSKDSQAIQNRASTPNSQRTTLISSNFLPESERILRAEQMNKWLDTTPTNNSTFKLRPRDKEKEIQPGFKTKPKSEHERISEKISAQKGKFDSSEPPEKPKTGLYKTFYGTEKPKFSGGREVLDYYHFKTHFKTIESLALDLHSSTRNLSKNEIKKINENEKLGMTEGKIKQRSLPKGLMSKEEVVPISGEILQKFGYWKTRKDYLKKESSRFISSRHERRGLYN